MISTKKIWTRLTAAALLLPPACTGLAIDNTENGDAGEPMFTLSLTVEGMGAEIVSRATVAAEPNETDVHTLTLFFFDPSGNQSGRFVDWIELSNEPDLLSVGTSIPIPTGDKAILASNMYHVIGVANASDYLPAGWKENPGENEAEFRQNVIAALPASVTSGRLLMNGSAVKSAGNGHIDMKLTRNVARFDVENNATGYTLVSARLRNICTVSSVTGDNPPDYAAGNTQAREGFSAAIASTDGAPIKGKLYAFENQAATPAQGDGITTCLIAELLENNTGVSSYYRINIHPEGVGQNILRNKVYATSITGVNETGYESAEAAYAGTDEGMLDYVINNWVASENGTEMFLKLSYETDWSGLLGPNRDEETKSVFVSASGAWKATLIGDDGFMLVSDTESSVTEISSNTPNGNFKISTVSSNPSKTDPRYALVIVSLNDDPLNCVGVVSLTQAIASEINIDPIVETITLDGSKSSPVGNPATNVSKHRIISTTGTITDVEITEANDRFGCSWDGEWLTVFTLLTNTSASDLTGKLRIADTDGSELFINLVQRPLTPTVIVTGNTMIGPEGGETGLINMSIDDPEASWKVNVSIRGVNGDIFNHTVKMVYASGQNTGMEVNQDEDLLTADTPVRLLFPIIYFPNREIDIRATISFTTTEGATANYTFTQQKLTSAGLRIWSTFYTHWGSLTPSGVLGFYMQHFNIYIRENGNVLASPGVYSLIASSSVNDYGDNVPVSTNWFQFSNHDANVAGEFAGVNAYFTANRGNRLTLIQAGHGEIASALNNYSFAGPTGLGYRFINSAKPVNSIRFNTNVSSTRVSRFIMEYGRKKITNIDGFGLYNDGVNGGVTNYPEGAVPLLHYVNASGQFDGSYNLVIDPENNVVYHGDETVFHETYYTNNSPVAAAQKSAFMANYIDYLVNAAKYGRHFTDMLREDKPDIPVMWDTNVWGANAWPARSYW